MLTKREREWLEDREKWNFKLDIYDNSSFCPSCKHCEYFTEAANGVFCQDAEDMWLYDKLSKCPLVPSKELLLDAAEFEVLVAALLAEILPKALTDPWFIKNAKHITADATLKWARLSVEEEMDGYNTM